MEKNAKLFAGIQDKIDELNPDQKERFFNSCKLMLEGTPNMREGVSR